MAYENCDIEYTPTKIEDGVYEVKIIIRAPEYIAVDIEQVISNALDDFASEAWGNRTVTDPANGEKQVIKIFNGNGQKTGNA